ncbi:MAG: hypothetical protein OHK0036_16510 [Bacteroidia bacterium]
MKKSIIKGFFAILVLQFINYNSIAQNLKNQSSSKAVKSDIEVIQFHSEHRCMTCKLIEKLTRETLQANFPNIPFKLVNVDDEKNAKLTELFEATGTALFIYNPKTGKKVDLTDFAFMNAKSKPDEFKKGLIDAIKKFK